MINIKIAVGGMIASGKSTLVNSLGEYFKLPIMEEFDANDNVFNTLLKWLYEGYDNVEMLLQVYFLHAHYLKQQEHNGDFIVDRDIIEHWLFAQNNLKHMPTIMNMYNGVFMSYMNQITKPDLYIILEISWDTFKDRIFKRGRDSEINNFDRNKDYFEDLNNTYVDKMKAQCEIYDIPYIVINVDNLSEKEVLNTAISYVVGII